MEIGLFFFVAAVVILILILKFEKKQTKKVNTLLRTNRGVPPMFMLKSTEQKVKALKDLLRYNDTRQNTATAISIAAIYDSQDENKRQSKIQEFKLLSGKYNTGQISLEIYNLKLDELLAEVNRNNTSADLVY